MTSRGGCRSFSRDKNGPPVVDRSLGGAFGESGIKMSDILFFFPHTSSTLHFLELSLCACNSRVEMAPKIPNLKYPKAALILYGGMIGVKDAHLHPKTEMIFLDGLMSGSNDAAI